MLLQEVIFAATSAPSSSSGPGAINIHDVQTGSSFGSFKQSNAPVHCTSFVESRNGQGGFVLAAQLDKSIINVYNFQKDQMALKIVLPEKLTCLTVDPRGEFCAGGTAQGRIYLWEIASGILYNSWDAHYRRVVVLKFTHDSAALLSGSEDSGVSVWSVSRLLDDDLQNELPMPYCTLSDHTLPVTDIVCGVGCFPTCRVLTSSVGHSVKLWDLAAKTLLTTFQFPQPIACLAWDVTERMFFAGAEDGSIHQMNLFRHKKTNKSSAAPATEAIGGAGVSDIIRIGNEPSDGKKRLISVGQPITCLAISLTSTLLLVGTAAGHIHIYDIPSHQALRTISTHAGLTITHLATLLKPPDLIGHASVSLSAADAKDGIPVKPVAPFQRMRDAKAREAHEVAMLLPIQNKPTMEDPLAYSTEEMLRDHAFFVQPTASDTTSADDGISLQAKVTGLEDEVMRLKEQLAKAKNVNDTMWETVVQRVMAQKKSKNEAMEVDTDGH
ncbi:hypothetical protein HGRIS_004745 [Hohenbuehelia grisea]|uniref:Pre-rRNA-processing protein IPI3 n=1 Tax=Hohenbuehelia grisea TaxID=104357 RepID=A0ABR3JCT9_9AGAR